MIWNVWKVLGIEPTDDLKTIKKAYAGKLRITLPDENPEGFQQLKEAYDQAVRIVKQGLVQAVILPPEAFLNEQFDNQDKLEEEQPEEQEEVQEDIISDYDRRYHFEEWEKPEYNSEEETLTSFILAAEQLIYNYEKRIDWENWDALLKDMDEWSLEGDRKNKKWLYHFLVQKYFFIPAEVARKLLKTTKLNDWDVRRIQGIDGQSYQNFLEAIEHAPDFSFNTYQYVSEEKLEYFWELRYHCYYDAMTPLVDEQLFLKRYKEGSVIYGEDADLHNLYVIWLMQKDSRWLARDMQILDELSTHLSFGLSEEQPENPTSIYLNELISVVKGRKVKLENLVILNKYSRIYVPNTLRAIADGLLGYYKRNYYEAYNKWSVLPEELKGHVSRKLKIADFKTTTFYHSMKRIAIFFMLLLAIALLFLFAAYIGEVTYQKTNSNESEFSTGADNRSDIPEGAIVVSAGTYTAGEGEYFDSGSYQVKLKKPVSSKIIISNEEKDKFISVEVDSLQFYEVEFESGDQVIFGATAYLKR